MNKKSANRQLHRRSQHRLKPVYAAVLLAFAVQTAEANPIGGTVTNGSAGFATSGNTLTVTNTPGTIINWQGFSIGSNEITNFAQQSASSTVLNRVVGNDPSNILGTLRSNGRVFLVNPNGILFGAGAVVDVAGLVASTLNLSNADFIAGRHHYTQVPGAGNISIAGNITAQDNGQIYLIAPNVENTGVITAPNGEILLAAGHSVDLVNTNDPNLRVNITAPAGDATNVGKLIASSGSLGLFGTVVRNSGMVNADSATMQGGKIVFKASQRVEAGGMISAQGDGGGTINLLADMNSGTVNVSGTLDASAPVSGNGGFIDTSAAYVQVVDSAHVTTAAAHGNAGTWLIDPLDFTIGSIAGNDITGTALSTMLVSNNVVISTVAGTNSATNLYATTTGNGDIFVNDAVAWNANTLTLNASRNININAGLNANLAGASAPTAGLVLEYGQGAVAAGNTAKYVLAPGATIDLSSAGSFSTKLGSDGTPLNYTIITSLGLPGSITGTDLQGINNNLSGNYVLGSNLDFSTDPNWTNPTSGLPYSFAPLGNYSYASGYPSFTGQLDGLGHSISNLYINLPGQDYVGLFGYMSGSVRNLGLMNASVTGGNYYYIGALAGLNAGTIDNSSSVSGNVTGNTGVYYVGGLVGENYGTISNSSASGSVIGNNSVGGLIGYNAGTISNSNASGNVTGNTAVGGLAGYNGGTISNSYVSTGYVWGNNLNVGGLVGNNTGTLINSHYDINAVAIQDSTEVTLGGLYNDNPTNGEVGQYDDWLNHGLTLNIANYASLSGSGNNYSINDVQGMKDLLGFADNAAYAFTLGTNIDLVNNAGLYIPYLAADFNGNNHSISNLNIYQPFNDNLGLFGIIATTGTVSNVVLTNSSNNSISGNTSVGSLAGWNLGTVSNSRVDNSNAYGGYVSGNSQVGGLVGLNNGTISSSYYDNTAAYGGSVSGNSNIGGLVGHNAAVTTYNNSVANSTGGIISNSYASNGTVSGGSDVGGLVGYSRKGNITGSYVTGGSVTGTSGNIGGLIGYNNSKIDNSYVSGLIQVQGISSVGGLVGYNDGSEGSGNISNSHFSGGTVTGTSDVGGLVGNNRGSVTYLGKVGGVISNSYVSNGAVTGSSSNVGGLVGYNTGTINDGSYVSGGSVTGGSEVGGLVGYSDGGSIDKSYVTTGNVSGGSNVGGLVGKNGGTTTYSYSNISTISNSYVGTGTVVSGSNNVGGLVGLNGGGVSVDGGSPASSTISASYVNGGTVGTVTGSSHVGGLVGYNAGMIGTSYVSGGTVIATGNDVGGLVGNNAGVVSGSYVSGGTVISKVGDSSGNAGGLVGYNSGSIDNSFVSNGSVSISSSATAWYVGGLVGNNSGTISNTYVSGGTVSGNSDVGGLVGNNAYGGTISNSYASTGVVGGTAGGLVGSNYGGPGSISASFWNTSVAGVSSGIGYDPAAYGGVVGLDSAGMMTMSNFTAAGWDMANVGGAGSVWRIYEGYTAPLLTSFLTQLSIDANANQTYNGVAYSGDPGVTYTPGIANPVLLGAWAGTSQGARNAGSYTIDASGLYSDQLGYDISYTNGNLTIGQATLSLNAVADSKTYDGTASSAGVVTATNLMTGDSVTATQSFDSRNAGARTLSVDAGYVINDGNGGLNYFTPTLNTASGTITPATLTLNAVTDSRIYDATTNSAGVVGYTGTFGADSVTGLTQSFASKNVLGTNGSTLNVNGSYTVNDGNGGANYTVVTNSALGTITPATLTVTADYISKIQNTSDPLLTYMVSGLKLGDTATATLNGALSRDPGEAIGAYQINQGTLGLGSANYTMTYAGATFSILAPITVTDLSVFLSGIEPPQDKKNKPKPGDDLIVLDTSNTGNPELQSLPMCGP